MSKHADHHHDHSHDHSCAHAHDHAGRAPEAIRAAELWCQEHGLRLTPIRRQALEALYATHQPLSAYDMIDKMVAAGAKRLAPITVYRALDFLVENGFVHRLASRNAFIACPFHHKPDELVVFMICDHCGGVDEALSDDLSKSLSVLTESHGFAPRLRIIECGGACAHCRDQTKAA